MLGNFVRPETVFQCRALRAALLAAVYGSVTGSAHAQSGLPAGGQVIAGKAAISAGSGALTVTQSSSRAIINWQSFSIGSGNSVHIDNGSGATLNRVITNNPSSIAGSLRATGSAYLINQNGIIVTPSGSVVTGGSFVAATRDTANDAFMAEQATRFSGTSAGNVVNRGKINAANGDALLIGQSVKNGGQISAPNGTAALVAGDDVLLQPSGSGLAIQVRTGSGNAGNKGSITAAQAVLDAVGGNVYALAGNNEGSIRASGTATINGHVWLTAGKTVTNAGVIGAQNGDGSGGAVTITGADAMIAGVIDAGARAAIASGGQISIKSVGSTQVTASLKAPGGGQGGNGGTVETSGEKLSTTGASIDASAPAGIAGTWLLDPYDLTVSGSLPTTASQSPAGTWTSGAGGSVVLNTDINAALNAGTSVVLQTSGSLGDGNGNGDITISAPIQMTGANAASLTLNAGGSVIVSSSITSTGGALSVVLDANTLGGGGYVNVAAPITTKGGSLVVGGGATPSTMPAIGTATQLDGVLVNGALTTGGGAITINGTGYAGGAGSSNGVEIKPNANINAGGGSISITGTGGNSASANNYGVYQEAAITTTGSGNITLKGIGGGTGASEIGYSIAGNITSGTGNVAITGLASPTATDDGTINHRGANDGVLVGSGTISTAGAGTITVAGTGAGTAVITFGVELFGGLITAVDGPINLTGMDNSPSPHSQKMGIGSTRGSTSVVSTGAGAISITGVGGGSSATGNDYGIYLTFNVQSKGTGPITITGTGGGGGNADSGIGWLGSVSSKSGDIFITGNGGGAGLENWGIEADSGQLAGGGAVTVVANGGANSEGFFGSGFTISASGPLSVTGNAGKTSLAGIKLGSILAAGTTVTLSSNGAVTVGAVKAASLALLGAGVSYTLTNAGNAVTTLAANTGSVNYSQTGALTIGTVGATAGITATGTVKVVVNAGNLTLANGVSAQGTGYAVILEAGASSPKGTVSGGDFINNAGAATLSTPNGYWLVYSGDVV
ncbi:MAG TPA: filamentous hemagglutinin N-terminal domain-containing protein, partial [Rhizomicrobium sp.]|nr:filamentous hemagglutinin N-terminal domain-containing protein [Rhizomicrobium sp.]